MEKLYSFILKAKAFFEKKLQQPTNARSIVFYMQKVMLMQSMAKTGRNEQRSDKLYEIVS